MIFNVTSVGGGTGCTLTVTAPVGATVTVSKDGITKPAKVATTGTVMFKGLETGTWTITITNGTDTASKTVEIKADYLAEITFFSATINITYPAGLRCTATNGSTTLTAPDTSGTWACTVLNAGTWTVTLDNGLYSTVTITNSGEKHTVDKWYLYNAGDEYSTVTGGWDKWGRGIVVKNADNIQFAATEDTGDTYGYCLGTGNAINLTGFKQVRARVTCIDSTYKSLYTVSIFRSKNYTDRIAYKTVEGLNDDWVTLDLSTLTDGAYYIGVTNGNTGKKYTVLYEMYLA